MTVDDLKSILQNPNVKSFLQVIQHSEGTAGPNAYQLMAGSTPAHPLLFTGDQHPRQLHQAGAVKSDAAGAYQIMSFTWDDLNKALHLPDFSPASQDVAALFLIYRRGALADVEAGNFDMAIQKCSREWASLPGAGYGQHEQQLAFLQKVYADAGGNMTT